MKLIVIISGASVAGVAIIAIAIILVCRKRIEIRIEKADEWLITEFERCNVMVFGKKGSGKDVLFAHVIALRNAKHYSNIPYDGNTEVIQLGELSAGGNTFENCINGNIRKFEPRFDEGCDIYISDVGIYFPNTSDRQLNEQYPSTCVLCALSRHLYNNNIHTNCQAFERPWKKLREQADSFIQVLKTRDCGAYLSVSILGYEKYRDAENETNPSVSYKVRVPKCELQYDSRYFRSLFLITDDKRRKSFLHRIRRVNYVKPN